MFDWNRSMPIRTGISGVVSCNPRAFWSRGILDCRPITTSTHSKRRSRGGCGSCGENLRGVTDGAVSFASPDADVVVLVSQMELVPKGPTLYIRGWTCVIVKSSDCSLIKLIDRSSIRSNLFQNLFELWDTGDSSAPEPWGCRTRTESPWCSSSWWGWWCRCRCRGWGSYRSHWLVSTCAGQCCSHR